MAGLRRLLEAGGAKVYTNGTKYAGSIQCRARREYIFDFCSF